MATDHETAKADNTAKLDRANAMLDRRRNEGSVRLSHLEWMRNELAELVEQHGAALDEVERLREYVVALNEAQVGLQTSAFYLGLKGFKAMPTAGIYTQAHLDTVEYAEELRAVNADSAPQQPERGGEEQRPAEGP